MRLAFAEIQLVSNGERQCAMIDNQRKVGGAYTNKIINKSHSRLYNVNVYKLQIIISTPQTIYYSHIELHRLTSSFNGLV